MLKWVLAASLLATPCAAQPGLYGALTMKQLSKVLLDERGIPNEVKSAAAGDVILVDSKDIYGVPGKIQVSGILCDGAAPPSCKGLALGQTMPAGISDAQLQALQAGFDFVVIHRLDSQRLVISMAMVIDGGVTAQAIDTTLAFFAGQYKQVSDAVAKLSPAKGG